MSTIEQPKTIARDRTEWGKGLSLSAPATSRFAEAVAVATAAGAVTLTVMNDKPAHATESVPLQQLPMQAAGAMQHGVYGTASLPESQGQAVASPDAVVSAPQEDGNHTEISHEAAAQPTAIGHQASASIADIPETDTNVSGLSSMATQSGVNGTAFDTDALVGRVAEQITSTIGSVLQASRDDVRTDGISQSLTKEILSTAQGIIEDINGHLSNVERIGDHIDNVISQFPSVPTALVGGAGDILGDAFAPDGIVGALTGSIGSSGISHALPPEGLVAELAGIGFAAAMPGAETSSSVIDIPATILGGSEPGRGALADLFYDDGASGHSIPSVSIMAEGQSSEPASLGFIGDTFSPAHELTGIFHSSSSLHLV